MKVGAGFLLSSLLRNETSLYVSYDRRLYLGKGEMLSRVSVTTGRVTLGNSLCLSEPNFLVHDRRINKNCEREERLVR